MGQFARLVKEVRPAVIVMENVKGLARVRGNSTYSRFLKTLRKCNYAIREGVLNAKDYGVAQDRKRLVLIASRDFEPSMPAPTHGPGSHRTVREVIEHYPPINAGEEDRSVRNHVAPSLSELNLKRIRATRHDGGGWHDWRVEHPELLLQCHIRIPNGYSNVYGRMQWDAPANTLTTRCTTYSSGRFGHPVQDRSISLREAAALQSFPDWYEFHGINSHIARQIGNAVPVKLAEAIGRHIMGNYQAVSEPR